MVEQAITLEFECRICGEEGSTGSPLVSPCACRGGSKYVHLECLMQWAVTKDDEEQQGSFSWQKGIFYRQCVTCKKDYFGETAVALAREALRRSEERFERATKEGAEGTLMQNKEIDVASGLNNLAQLLQVCGSTTRRRC